MSVCFKLASSRATDRLMLLAAAALFSTGGAAVKASSMTSWQLAGCRSLTAAFVLFILLPQCRKRWSLRMLPVAGAYAATLALYVVANRLTTAANAIFLQSAAPLYIVVLGPLLLREKLFRRDIVFGAAVFIGMAFFFVSSPPPAHTAPNPGLGNLIGVVVGVVWALTLLGLRWLGRSGGSQNNDSAAAVVCGNLMAFLACSPFIFPMKAPSMTDWSIVLYLGVFQIGLAYVLVTRSMRRVPAFEASLLLLAEPVLNPLWAWLIHSEHPGAWALIGGAVILVASSTKVWFNRSTTNGESV
ncbi:MAG: EamA family transporter [bacterium]|nr:EamA family transporter [bacterium]